MADLIDERLNRVTLAGMTEVEKVLNDSGK